MATLKCVFCKTPQTADKSVRAILCGSCTARLAGTPEQIGKAPKSNVPKVKRVKRVPKEKVVKATAGFGRGWHLKKAFTAPDGTKYSFGQPVGAKKGKRS
jgi:hypothetical protein